MSLQAELELAVLRTVLEDIDLLIGVRGAMDPNIILDEIHVIVRETLDHKVDK